MRTTMRLIGHLVVAVTCAGAAKTAGAQTLAETPAGSRVQLTIRDSLRQGPFQRARQNVIGQFVRANTDSVWLHLRGTGEFGVARTSITKAQVSTGASRWKSSLLLGVGWGLGMAAAIAIDDLDHDHEHRARDAWIGAGVGLGAGLVVGATLPFEMWRGVR